MATTLLSPNAKQQFLDNAGVLAAGYKLYTYAANTLTPRATYTDRAGLVANANPIILDARGEAIIYLTPGVVYDYVLKTGADVTVWTREDVIADAGDANAVNFIQSGTGAVSRTVQDKNRERVSPEDFGCVGGGVVDDTVNYQKAVTYCIANGRRLEPAATTYRFTAPIVCPGRLEMVGQGCVPYDGTTTNNIRNKGGGTWFYFDHTGKGFNFDTASGETTGINLRNFGTYRNQPNPGVGWTPTANDWDISANQVNGGDCTFEDIFLRNATKGILATGRACFRHIRGQAFQNFISTTFNADTTRFNSCHVWPYWSDQVDVRAYTLDNLTAFRLGRVDNPTFTDSFSIFAKEGIAIVNDGLGTVSKLRLVNSDFDGTRNGIVIYPGADGATMLINNLQSQGQVPLTGNGFGIWIQANNCVVNLDQVSLGYHRSGSLRVDGTGNAVYVGTIQCYEYDQSNAGFSAIECAAANQLFISSRPRITRTSGYTSPLFGGAGQISAPLNQGEFTGTTSAGGDVTVTHSANIAPRNFTLTARAPDIAMNLRVESVTATTFVVRARTANTGAVIASAAVDFYWRADY